MISKTHPSWHDILESAYSRLSPAYREFLESNLDYFPDKYNLFNAFRLPLDKTKYILFGQDPYPRYESAIGYAFIDGRVRSIFGKNGLTPEVNRATSLRNFIKMLLVCDERLKDDFSKEAVAKIQTDRYINDIIDLKNNFEKNGVLLLNMALIFSSKDESRIHIKEWNPFIRSLLESIKGRDIDLILFGKIANDLDRIDEAKSFKKHLLPHPYNISFITNKNAHAIFKEMGLLKQTIHQ